MARKPRYWMFGCAALICAPSAAWAQDLPVEVQEMLNRTVLAQDSGTADANTPADEEPPASVEEASVAVSPTGTITLNVVDLPLTTVLRILALETNRNIVATPNVRGTVTASLHDVSFEQALDAILAMNNAGYRAVGRFIYVYTAEELAEIYLAENPPTSRVFLLNYVPAQDVEAAVRHVLSPIGQVSISPASQSGIASNPDEAGGDSFAAQDYVVVFDRPDRLEAVEQLIRGLDVRPRQVLVEATILSAELNEDNALGVDFTILGGVDLEVMGSTSTAVQNVTVGQLPTDRFDDGNASIVTGFTQNVPDGGVRVGIISDHVAVFIQALEQITDTVVLANPKVLALNKQRGQVIVGRRDGYITTTVTETQAIQTVEFLETGTQLIFRPFISDDGFVRMELHPEDSIGGVNASNLPFEQTTEVTTNVVVKDGQTILIGGLFREVDSDNRSQIPLLGDIPVLGAAFQSRNDSLLRQEVIILLTVHVVKDNDKYADESWAQMEDMERLRVGMRQGQMWQGRERIAQAYYRSALEHYAKGDLDRALWDVRMSLHNNPRSLSAIRLMEEIRSQREWDDDSTSTRMFIHQAILQERGADERPFFERIAPPFKGSESFEETRQPDPSGDIEIMHMQEQSP